MLQAWLVPDVLAETFGFSILAILAITAIMAILSVTCTLC